LKSLQEELSASQKERAAAPAPAALVAKTPEDLELGDQLHQLTNEVTHASGLDHADERQNAVVKTTMHRSLLIEARYV
jgi:hypothetical protein